MSALLYSINRLPCWKQSLAVDEVKYFAPTFDRLLYLFLHKNHLMGQAERKVLNELIKPGMRILDIGANIGIYALPMARLTGEKGSVTALEPDPDLYAALCSAKEANQAGNLQALCVAAGERNEKLMLSRSSFNSGDNRVVVTSGEAFPDRVKVAVQAKPLDEICGNAIFDFIKMDVQGYEPAVLAGGEQVFNSNPHLQVLLEYWPQGIRRAGGHPESLLEKMASWGFSFRRIDDDKGKKITDFKNLTESIKGSSFIDLLATRQSIP